jgi:hypothetical protein
MAVRTTKKKTNTDVLKPVNPVLQSGSLIVIMFCTGLATISVFFSNYVQDKASVNSLIDFFKNVVLMAGGAYFERNNSYSRRREESYYPLDPDAVINEDIN